MNYIAYYRVSTDKQGASGLGLEAQQEAVQAFLKATPDLAFTEIESGACSTRPELAKALAACKQHKATLVVAKLDRLARDVQMILSIVDSGINVRFIDLPEIDPSSATGRFMLTMMASIAELERRIISQRTKAALKAKKARGETLGSPDPSKGVKASIEAKKAAAAAFDAQVLPFIRKFQQAGHKTSRAIADQLTLAGIQTYRGGSRWGHAQVCEILRRAA
jgi:DNA invertase Pin-like site-specific DNA recombinase